jgi:hypothetical protein
MVRAGLARRDNLRHITEQNWGAPQRGPEMLFLDRGVVAYARGATADLDSSADPHALFPGALRNVSAKS